MSIATLYYIEVFIFSFLEQLKDAIEQSKLIFVDDASANIEENDVFTRILPNGNEERYRVLDRGHLWSFCLTSD